MSAKCVRTLTVHSARVAVHMQVYAGESREVGGREKDHHCHRHLGEREREREKMSSQVTVTSPMSAKDRGMVAAAATSQVISNG